MNAVKRCDKVLGINSKGETYVDEDISDGISDTEDCSIGPDGESAILKDIVIEPLRK